MIADLTRWILGLHGWAALAIVFAVPLAESSAFAGFVFPGEIAIVLGGVLASQHRVPLFAVLIAAVAGAILGDTIGYAVGRRWGRTLLYGTLGRVVKHEHLDRAERYLAERGGKAVFLGRHTAALRVLIPGMAGMARMPYRTFAVYNILGGLVWAIWNTLLGYLAGAGWKHVTSVASTIGLLILVVLILSAGLVVAIRAVRRRTGRFRALADQFGGRIASTGPALWTGRRFPRQLAWLRRRLDPGTPAGLALTTMLAAAVFCGWIFAGLIQDVLAHDRITRLDQRVQTYLVAHRTPSLTAVMEASTWLGSTVVLVPVLAATSVYLVWGRRDLRTALNLWLALGGAVVFYEGFKFGVAQARPPAAQMIIHVGGYAYPSGHATQATVIWGLLAFLLATDRPWHAARARALILGVAAAVIVLVGASRLYLGVHWLSDVLGGYALGAVWLALLLAHRLRNSQTCQPKNPVVVADGKIDRADPP